MDLNDDINDDLDIRAPDPVIRERLLDDNDNDAFINYNNNNYNNDHLESDFDRIMKESLEEFELAETQKVQEMIAMERSKITEKYTNIKGKLQKVQCYDTANKDTYETIISIIEMYESNFIVTYSLDETSHANIFKLIKTIRLTKEEFDLLESLIIL